MGVNAEVLKPKHKAKTSERKSIRGIGVSKVQPGRRDKI
jgi:hypothetical protein